MTTEPLVTIAVKVPQTVKGQLEKLARADDRALSLYLKRLLTVHVNTRQIGPS